jgi:hypothetical protein
MYTQEQIIEKFKRVHGDKYDYSKVEFIKTTMKVCIICPEHGEFWQEPHCHIKGQGCPKCSVITRAKSKTSNNDDFIAKAKKIYGDLYDYSKVEYVNNKTMVTIICPIHGEFKLTPHSHIGVNHRGCPKCGNSNKGNRMNQNDFIKRSIEIHNGYYSYENVSYINNRTPVIITCPIHGDFNQTPDVHLNGHGCPICAKLNTADKNTKTSEEFILQAKKIHGDRYNYSKVDYKRNDTPVSIICPEHGEFQQKPLNHLNGCGCPKCSMMISHYEIELGDFIASIIGEENIIRNDRTILDGNELDIYIPTKNIAFEFDGLYWHSEIKKPDKNYHLKKTNICENKGIQLIHIFEDEWIHKNDICKSRIKNLLGVSERIYARKCKIIEVDKKDAKKFFIDNHIQGNVNAKIIYGLKYNNEIVSMMSFGELRKNLGQKATKGHFELLRFANKQNTTVIGGASKLFNHFIKMNNPIEITSYADRRWSKGNLYEQLNFEYSHNSDPNYFYVINDERKNRFGFRKDILISKYGCLPNDTEHNFCKSKGWCRIYDCGTKVYKWKKHSN